MVTMLANRGPYANRYIIAWVPQGLPWDGTVGKNPLRVLPSVATMSKPRLANLLPQVRGFSLQDFCDPPSGWPTTHGGFLSRAESSLMIPDSIV